MVPLHHYIGTEHLLLGLVREGEGIAAGVLASLGVNLERLRRETTAILSAGPVPVRDAPADPGPPPPTSLQHLYESLNALRAEKDAAMSSQRYEHAARLREQEVQLQTLILRMEDEWRADAPGSI